MALAPSLRSSGAQARAVAISSACSLLHGGLGNTALSLGEDVVSGLGLWLALIAPIVAAVLSLALLGFAIWLLVHFAGVWRRWLASRRASGTS